MKRWQEEFTKHPIHSTIQSLKNSIVSTEDLELKESYAERVRFQKFLNYLETSVQDLDPDLAPIDILNQITNTLNSHGALNTAINIVNSRDLNLFQELNTRVNPVLSYIAQLPPKNNNRRNRRHDIELATTELERFSRKTQQLIKKLESEVEEIRVHAKAAGSSAVNAEKMQADALRNFELKLQEWHAQQSELISAFSVQFQKEQGNRSVEYAELVSQAKASASNELELTQQRFNDYIDSNIEGLNVKIDKVIFEAEENLSKIKNFYHLTGQVSVTGGHMKIADREYDSAEIWRYISLASLFLSVAWLLLSMFRIEPTLVPAKLFWLNIAKSASITMILVSLSVYASKQASLHRENERRVRDFFLKVQAFDPFIASLPDDKKVDLKMSLSTRIFDPEDTNSSQVQNNGYDMESTSKVLEVMERIKGLLSK